MPTLQAEREYSTQVHVWVTPVQRQAIKDRAKELGLNSSALIRMAVIEFLERTKTS